MLIGVAATLERGWGRLIGVAATLERGWGRLIGVAAGIGRRISLWCSRGR
jgi:hypothetical protein